MSLWNSSIWNASCGAMANGTRPLTARRLIYDAYRALGVLRPGQLTSPEGHDDALGVLNDLVDSWNTESLMIPALKRDVYALVPGVGAYTIGPGGTLGGERPQRIVSAALVSCGCGCGCAGGGCTQLEIGRSFGECHVGCGIAVNYGYPDIDISINPPPASGQALAIQSWGMLSGFADLETTYGFAPGYALALRWSLAQQLAPLALIMMKIPNNLLQVIEQRAIDAKAAIKSFNSSPPPELKADSVGTRYNVYTDSYH